MSVDDYYLISEAVGYRCLSELRIGVLGMGHMGRSIAKVFSGFFDSVFPEWFCCLELGCDVVGLVSSPRGPTQHVTQYYTGGELSGMMSGLDYLINVLPATQETNNLLTRYIIRYIDRGFKQILEKTSNIARMSASSILVVGTSSVRRTFCLLLTTTSSAELSLTSLIWSRFLKIPLCGLTKTSWVWTIWLNLCQVFVSVTPHVAGESRAEDVAECFIQNLREDLDGRDPSSLVDWSKLY